MATNRRRQQNTGYTTREDGTAISIRGAYAEENGKFSEGRFRFFYHVAKRDFNVLLSLGLIRSEEWHHTGARFNRSDFYEWSDANEVDYSEVSLDGHFPEGSLAEKYFSNRKAVSALVKESESKPWEYVSENFGHFNIPSFEDYIKAAVEKPDVYSHENSLNYNLIRITGKGIEDYLSAGQKEERQNEHSSISLQGEKAGSAAYRRELHLDVDRKYNRIAIDSIPEDILHEAYENAYADDIKHNSEVEGKITEAHAKNTASDGKEKMLIRIAELMGVEHSDAERRAYSASMSNLAAAGYSWNVQKRQEYDSQIDAVLADIEKKQKDYVKKLIKQGRAERRERIASLPQMFATEKEEMNGRYGWFDANSNYNLPRYYTGVEFKDRRGFNHYNDIKKNSLNIIEVLHDKRDYEIASGPSEEDIKRLRMQKSGATVSDVVSTKDAMLRDELIRRMRESGINVVTNERQAQRALERANNRVKFSGDAPKGVAANPVIYTSYNVDDVDALKEKYPSELSDKYYHHSTVKYGYQPLDTREGKKERLHIIGRLTTDKVDVLVVENPESDNRTPHITLATAKGIKPVASNFELEKYKDKIQPLDDYVDVTFTNNLRGGIAATPVTTPDFKEWFGDWEKNPEQASKVVNKDGKPLIVEHGTNNDFTEFDINRLGETSHDKGIYGAGFYFATEAPAWLNARNKMKVYLDIKKPFEITASMENDIYTSFSEKLDTPAFRALKLHTFNDKEISVGEYIDVIKAVDDFIEHNSDQVNEQIAQDEELQSYHPKDRLQMWREGEISKRSGAAVLAHSWNVIISSMIGSEEFTKAAKESGYDGVIVNRDKDYREYVAFEPNQIKSATENIGTYRRDSNDIRFQKAEEQPIFISNAMLALDKIKQEKATPEQWLKMLEKNGGIKAGEDRWTGLSEWLRSKNDIKGEQLKLILNSNPHDDSIGFEHTWIRQKEDIKTFEESFGEDYDIHESQAPDYTVEMISSALKSGKITVYSSHPIEDGAFVTPSKMEAQNYAGGGQVYSKEINLKDVAWIDPMQGQYAPVKSISLTKSEIVDYLNENMIEVEEVHYADPHNAATTSEQLKAFQGEFDAIKENIDKLFNEAEKEYSGFMASMKEKYGEIPEDKMSDNEFSRKRYLINNCDAFDTSHYSPNQIAHKEMVSRYGDDWGMAFYFDEDGQLFPADEDRAIYFLGDEISVDKSINDTRLQNTTLGLTNNREIALTVPSVEPYIIGGYMGDVHFDDAGDGRAVAWVRFGETTNPDGERVLVIDEIQSKRHQDGREKGYGKSKEQLINEAAAAEQKRVELANKHRGDWETYRNSEEYKAAMRDSQLASDLALKNTEAVPYAPFEKNWQELCMKRMLRYAAENGFDRVAWTTGQQQAERYNIGKFVDGISIYPYKAQSPSESDGHDLSVRLSEGTTYEMFVQPDGTLNSNSDMFNGKNVSEVFGKDLGEKIKNANTETTLNDESLRIGAEGMKGFYDSILVKFTDKYTKQWGVKTEDVLLPELTDEERNIGVTMHSVPVTEQMRSDVMQGQPMFFKTQAGTAYGFALDGKIFVDTKIATAETPIHEYTHLWAEVLREQNPREWKNIVSLMKGAPEIWNKVVKQYPELHSDDEIADEVLAQYSGKRGYERLIQMQSEGEVSKGALDKLMEALEKLWKKVAEFFSIHYTSKEEVADRVLRDLLSGVNPRQEVEKYLQRQDKQYMKAVERGDEKKVQEIFQKSLRFAIGNGMTPYIAVDGYRGKLAGLARKVKTMDKTAINTAADKMAPLIPRNAVLVPAPSHKGEATDMLKLAKAISRRRHVEVMDVLKSYERERQYTSKKFGGKAIASDNMGIVAIKDIPEGKIPVVIDNVVSTGNTAEACVKALGFGIVVSLADATTAYKHTASLKSAAPVMRNQAGEVIPLSKRFDLSGAKYIGHAAALQKVDSELSLEFSDTREKSNSPVQGLEGYSHKDIEDIVESYVQDILDESDIDATIENVTVIGSRSRNEAKADSDLDILLEYSGEDYPEDAMYNLLHDDENPLEIEGLKVDINPINPHYSLSTEEWLARDARWREEDKKKNSINNKKANLMKESIDKPYIIHIGTDDRGIVEGEFHVQFADDNIKLNFDDISKYLKENGGVMRLMDGKPWFDFYDKGSAERFAEQITSIGKNITNTINSKEMEKQNENKAGREPMKKIEVLRWAMNHIGANHGSKALEINFEPDYYGITIGNNVPALADVQKMCDDLGISRESVQSKGHTIQVQLPKDWPDTIGQEQYIPTGNEMWKRANKEIGSHLGYFVEGYDPGYERGVGKTVFFDDLQKAKDFCDKESQRAKTGVWHEVYEVAHETRTPALYVSSWDNKENKVVDITSDVYKYEESNDKNLNDSILRPDLIKRVGELGIDYTPVGLSKGINIEVENEDGEKKPMIVKFASVSDKNVMLFANVYDVFDDSKGVSIDELPEYKKATIFESLRATLANGGEKQIVIVQDKADVPSYALPAIVNGDFSGIDNEQDEKDIRAFMDKNAGCVYDIQPGSEGFIPFPAFGKGADCETVFIVKPTTPEKLLEEKTAQNVAQKSNEKLSESEVLKGKATVSPDGEVVSMTNDKGEKEDFRHVHGGTHDDPALISSNTGIQVYFYDSEKQNIEEIDYLAGIDAYEDRKGMFLVRANEYNEAYYQLEAHDRSYDEGEAAARVYSRYKDCEKENGEKPLYSEVTVLFNGETEKEKMIIKLSNDIDERDDEKVFFNVDGLDGLRKLMSPNNGEDFKIVDQDGIDFLPASTFLGENKQQEKENSKTLAPVVPTNELIEQYNKLKAKHPDTMLLFRTGDFYEVYMDDAKEAARDLGIIMTKHSTLKEADGSPLRFAAFPHHALDTYLPKLIRTGHRVAICDQLFNREELQKQAKGRITETVGQSQELSKQPATKQIEKPEQEQVKETDVESTALFKDKKIWNLVIITSVGEDKLRQVVVPSPEDIDAFFKEAKGKTKDEAESIRNALGEKYLAKIADGSVKPIESRRISSDEKPSYVKQYAELMVAKIREMKEAQDKGDKNGWKKPWIGISGVPRSIYGNAYVGANNFLLSLYSEKMGYKVPVFATHSRFDDLNFTTDKRGKKHPATDKNGNTLPKVHILKGEHSFPVWFTNVSFVNKETKEKISYKEYRQLSKEEREAYEIKRVKGRHNVFCVEQTNLKDARPELYKKLSEPYTMKDVTKQGQAIDFTPVDLMVAEDLWICPVNIKEGSDRAFFSLGDNAITLPAKTQFFKDEDYYSTMFHEMGHSTGIGPLHNRDFGGEFGSPQYAKEELVAELTAAIVASQQGMSKEIKEESAKYLSSWLDAIEADPDYLMNVLHDVDKASATINIRISDIQEQLSKGIGADYSEIREMNNDLRSRYSPGLVIAAAEPAPESELSVEEEDALTQEESQTQEAEEQRGKGLKM